MLSINLPDCSQVGFVLYHFQYSPAHLTPINMITAETLNQCCTSTQFWEIRQPVLHRINTIVYSAYQFPRDVGHILARYRSYVISEQSSHSGESRSSYKQARTSLFCPPRPQPCYCSEYTRSAPGWSSEKLSPFHRRRCVTNGGRADHSSQTKRLC